MAKSRLLAPWVGSETERRSAMYHCVSRVVDRQFIFGDEEREMFVSYMRMYERFCGVRVVSYCVMSNHFHLLVEVPPSMESTLSDVALVERLRGIYSDEFVEMVRTRLADLADEVRINGNEKARESHAELREKFTRRMWDLGQFMKTLKQIFTRWYNKEHERVGTLWEARYTSVLVENGHAARVMAAYIDLNPVRAGMVSDPKDYRWCSYAEAVAGGRRGDLARRGIARVIECCNGSAAREADVSAFDGWEHYPIPKHYEWRGIAGRYRLLLYEDGVEVRSSDGRSKSRRGVKQEELEREQNRDGELSMAEVLRCKTRYFVDGGVIGGRSFVKGVIGQLKGGYLQEDRKSDGFRLPQMWDIRRGDKERGDHSDNEEALWSMRRMLE